ncbi:dephospho-CoA kinase [Bifidobacterium jacchi]|uniref:Dephospho-CoA kinase n=1 Tax=Bifidobacterium jacchi TaxID=2490545 RepID=A0A5N5RM94_9BIFI|nr:dephospho-CoA kinase [Bifidobacterium jacchi]KAB5608417.1 dephospho-CoA kinase [Bifidobacterium jacchi]
MRKFMRIGLTGGIAAGKTTVSHRFAELGATLIDYDQLARQVVAPGSVGLRRIVETFGPNALAPDGTMNRGWMAEHVFGPDAPADALERLNTIEHPLIYAEAERLERAALSVRHDGADASAADGDDAVGAVQIVVHDIPLLAEVIDSIPFRFDHIVTVEAPAGMRIARMMATRGMSRAQAEDRIRHQSSVSERRAIADIIIDATQPLPDMLAQVDRLYAGWVKDARRRSSSTSRPRLQI